MPSLHHHFTAPTLHQHYPVTVPSPYRPCHRAAIAVGAVRREALAVHRAASRKGDAAQVVCRDDARIGAVVVVVVAAVEIVVRRFLLCYLSC